MQNVENGLPLEISRCDESRIVAVSQLADHPVPGELVRFSAMSHCYTEAKEQFANTLKHTPSGGTLVLRAAPHFWEAPRRHHGAFARAPEISLAAPEQRRSQREGFPARAFLPNIIRGDCEATHPGAPRQDPDARSRFPFLLPMDQG